MCCEFLLPCPPALLPDRGLSVSVLVVMVRLMLERQEHGGTSIQETEVETEVVGGGHHTCIHIRGTWEEFFSGRSKRGEWLY